MNGLNTTLVQPQPVPEENNFGYGQLISIFVKRSPWLLGALCISLLGAFWMAISQKPTYLSSMQLIVEPNFESRLNFGDLNSSANPRMNDVDYATQLNIMRSDQFLVQTIQRLQVDYPELNIEDVKKDFELIQVQENNTDTRIFAASYQGNSPELTQQFLQVLKSIYLEYNEQQQQERLSRGLDFIDQQLESTRVSLRNSQAALEEFRENANIIDPSIEAEKMIESINATSSEKQAIQASLAETQSKYQLLLNQLQLSPDKAIVASRLAQSQQVQALLNQLQITELEVLERRTVFADADPALRVLLRKQQDQEKLLRNTVNQITRATSDNPSMMNLTSDLQLGETDLSLISELLLTNVTLQGLNARLSEINQSESELRLQLNNYPRLIAEYDRLQPEVEIERQTLQRLLQEREQLTSELARGGFVWQVIEEPDLGEDISFGLAPRLLLGGVFGLFLGGILAFAKESTDVVIHTSEQLQQKVPFRLLGTLPKVTNYGFVSKFLNQKTAIPTTDSGTDLHFLEDYGDLKTLPIIQPILSPKFQESIDIISNILLLNGRGDRAQTLVITSTLPQEGKTTVTWGLAYSLARMNYNVLVIDANLRGSKLHSEIPSADLNMRGLSTYLVDGDRSSPLYKRLDFGAVQVSVIPAGPIPDDPLFLLSSPRFKQLISECRQLYDVVLVDTSPLLGIPDTIKISTSCDGVVLVSRLEQITHPDLSTVASILSSFNVVGVVANCE